ncbi:MAG: redox-sensing transcriptional repressor Rex [Epulopiscium sp.]|nr:redox-sensing transcriptional repressor Rex [Candidatus Epulonipiscium sp.]
MVIHIWIRKKGYETVEEEKKISIAVIKRLPRYFRYLGELLENDVTRISSRELSERMGVTASQIRQDLNNFGGFGQQGYGYNVEYLYQEIGKILGLENTYNVIIVGVGNLGQALANYTNFERRGFVVKGLFDVNPRLIGMSIRGIEIQDIDNMEKFVKEEQIDIAILTLPKSKAPKIGADLTKWGIKGIWNFSPNDLKLPKHVIVENVHLSDSLMTLSYKLNVRKLEQRQRSKKRGELGLGSPDHKNRRN